MLRILPLLAFLAVVVRIILDTLRSAGLAVRTDWSVDVGLTSAPFGIDWVPRSERRQYGSVIPQPDPNNQLRVLAGTDGATPVQILILDERTYSYEPGGMEVQPGRSTAVEAENRLRRDVRDFLEYVRGQGGI